MYAKLKGLSSTEVNLKTYWPDNENCFGFLIDAQIGPEREEREYIFQILVCTPDWIKKEYSEKKIVWGQYKLIVFEYDLKTIKSAIERYVESCPADNWETLAKKIARIGRPIYPIQASDNPTKENNEA